MTAFYGIGGKRQIIVIVLSFVFLIAHTMTLPLQRYGDLYVLTGAQFIIWGMMIVALDYFRRGAAWARIVLMSFYLIVLLCALLYTVLVLTGYVLWLNPFFMGLLVVMSVVSAVNVFILWSIVR